MAATLDPLVVKRLAFIRFLHEQGVEQSHRPEPLAATALLSFHDAVESFLLLAAEHLSVNISNKITFDGYWGEIGAKLPAGVSLPARGAMRRLNNLRVNLKHHGSFPSGADLQQTRADVATFLLDASLLIFDVDFTSLDMIDLVTQSATAQKLRHADAAARSDDHIEALALLWEAFDELLRDYAARKRGHSRGPYDFGAKLWHGAPTTVRNALRLGNRDSDTAALVSSVIETGKNVDALTQTIRAMQEGMRVLAVGLDYRRYARFSMLVPKVDLMMDGSRHVSPFPGLQVGEQEYAFCRNFVIESALHLASMDFDLDLPALWRASVAGPVTDPE